MPPDDAFHFVTVGTTGRLVQNLWSPIAAAGGYRISHVVHPSFTEQLWPVQPVTAGLYFLRESGQLPPPPDYRFLASLERDDVPTIHNMLLSDRHVSKLDYEEGLAYATQIARRLILLFEKLRPGVVIGGFDGLHGSLGLAIARRMSIPWFAMQFTSMPAGMAAFCANLSPASTVTLEPHRADTLKGVAGEILSNFESRDVRAPAYIPPALDSLSESARQIPNQIASLRRVLSRRRLREFLKFTDYPNTYSVSSQFREALRLRRNLWRLRRQPLLSAPIAGPYAFFGLHMQPESSIDVFAHFFSNQVRVIELIARSLPPTHKLLVKLHKSDAPNYSTTWLRAVSSLPGVQCVSPFADSFEFIRRADLIFSIQGTIGLETALLGRPLILFGDSPVKRFPSASTIGKTTDLPALVREKLSSRAPSREQIVGAFAGYLAPFYPASLNNWGIAPTEREIEGYVHLFKLLEHKLVRAAAMVPAPPRAVC